jgi:hypothetical protein
VHGLRVVTDFREWIRLCRILERAEIRELKKKSNPKRCAPTCPGWFIATVDGVPATEHNEEEIERCDECRRFRHDDDACRYVIRQLRKLGLLGAAPCGSETCELCYQRLNFPDFDPEFDMGFKRSSQQTRDAHRTLFALTKNDAEPWEDWTSEEAPA